MIEDQGWLGEAEFVAAWIDIHPVESVRDAWFQAECGRCSWVTTGHENVCEDAAHEHAKNVHARFGSPAPLLMLSDDGETYVEMPPRPPIPIRRVGEPETVPRELRHPSSMDAGWRPFVATERLNHVALGDIIDTLEAIGYQLRLQIREKP